MLSDVAHAFLFHMRIYDCRCRLFMQMLMFMLLRFMLSQWLIIAIYEDGCPEAFQV